jgi:hypothetical protein
MSPIRQALSCLTILTVLGFAPAPAQAAPLQAAPAGASTQGSSSCVALGPWGSCATNAIETTKDNHCVSASVGVLGYGNIYDINGDHVGPYSFYWSTTVCGLYNWYYLVVTNFNVSPYVTVGTISN